VSLFSFTYYRQQLYEYCFNTIASETIVEVWFDYTPQSDVGDAAAETRRTVTWQQSLVPSSLKWHRSVLNIKIALAKYNTCLKSNIEFQNTVLSHEGS